MSRVPVKSHPNLIVSLHLSFKAKLLSLPLHSLWLLLGALAALINSNTFSILSLKAYDHTLYSSAGPDLTGTMHSRLILKG